MEQFTKIRCDAAAFLKKSLGTEICVVEEFPEHTRAVRQDSVAVGLDTVELCGRQVQLVLRFDLFSRSGYGCHKLFDRLCAALICQNNELGVSKITCGDLKTEKMLSGDVLTAKAELSGILTDQQDTDGLPLKEVIIKTKGVNTV